VLKFNSADECVFPTAHHGLSAPKVLRVAAEHLGFLQILLRDPSVIALQLQCRFIAQDPQIGRCRIEKELLLGAFQFRPSDEHLLLRRFRLGAEAAEHRLFRIRSVIRAVPASLGFSNGASSGA